MVNEHYRNVIVSIIKHAGGRILGSKLGFLLKKELDWTIASNGMTIKGFVTEHAGECLKIDSPQGQDVEYALLNHETASGWALFKNPSLVGIVVVRDQKDLITLKSEQEKELQDIIIPRLSHEDQKNVMRQFVHDKVGGDQAANLLGAIALSDGHYWRQFSHALKETSLVAEWGSFRHNSNIEILRQRLIDSHIAEENIGEIVSAAIATGSAIKHTKPLRVLSDNQARYRTIQELASAVVLNMTDEQLSSLNLPLGEIWKALGKQRQ